MEDSVSGVVARSHSMQWYPSAGVGGPDGKELMQIFVRLPTGKTITVATPRASAPAAVPRGLTVRSLKERIKAKQGAESEAALAFPRACR